MNDFNWTCPHCNRDVTISEANQSTGRHSWTDSSADGRLSLGSQFIRCPNPKCRKLTLMVGISGMSQNYEGRWLADKEFIRLWNLIPEGSAKPMPDYVPAAIRENYVEACLISNLSPKASATLSRRCLQGILRDFWGVKPDTLFNEIKEIESKVDAETWAAIDAVRKIGNIGAHMEKDINVIVDVDPNEATLLIELVETVIREWYVARHDRQQRMAAIVASAAEKDLAKKAGPAE